MDKKITINKERCIHCGLCIQDCITGCLEFDEGCFPKYKNGGANKCIACQHCMAICPKGALAFGSRNPDDSDKVTYGNSEELLGIIKSRRSIREYKNENISLSKFDVMNYVNRTLKQEYLWLKEIDKFSFHHFA